MREAVVIGAGLAGCEAAWALANAGVAVKLIEQKPAHYSPAHKNPDFAELVCSNSLKAARVETAAGLLKEEMRRLGSLTMACAAETAVPAGGALAVDRDQFAALCTRRLRERPEITVVCEQVKEFPRVPAGSAVVVATGPLTADPLADALRERFGGTLSFYDAVAPIVTAESLDWGRVFLAARYERGEADYVNCPFNKEEYDVFQEALVAAERAPLHEFEQLTVYEGCMPVEVMARRGHDTLRYGPLRPVGLRDPRTGRRPWANVQLRRENAAGTLYNLVGFQTNLRFGEQKRVFSMIPGLAEAEFVRYGVMHRNTFLDSPRLLTPELSLRGEPGLYFAGQLTGVEGYIESAAAGIVAGQNAARYLEGRPGLALPPETMLGALLGYITDQSVRDFQPMGSNMGILPPLSGKIKGKQERYAALSARALAALEEALKED